MSVQFGRWNFEGPPPATEYIEKARTFLAPYGPDTDEEYSKGGVKILYRAFHTTKEARGETQPHTCPSGAVITWDGCLDNRAELISELRDSVTGNSTDVAIVAAAYEKWGINCFAKLIGNWALSIWNPLNRSLILAKDPIGIRHLYYSMDKDNVTWSSIVDPIVLLGGKTYSLDEEYIAGWLSMCPAAHLSPWTGIHSVPPSSFVFLRSGKRSIGKYWEFDPTKKFRYRTDAEYEEHFRVVFGAAVQRSLRSDCPILAELSGGRDSSSIVSMADTVIARGAGITPRLDTISWFDDSEPNWNERPYFTKVEEKRGRRGWHIDLGAQDSRQSSLPTLGATNHVLATPGADGRPHSQFRACIVSQGNRVVLSGIGGDEVMGGIPTPLPELQDLLARARVSLLAHQVTAWALEKRKPWFHLLFGAAKEFSPLWLVDVPKSMRPVPWLQANFVKSHRTALTGYPSRKRLFGDRPTFQESMGTLAALQRQLICKALPWDPHYEKRYPYLDRALLEFMFAIPRDQIVRPAQRRSLMRRALVGIVPNEILDRKTKAFVARSPLMVISNNWAYFEQIAHNMLSNSLGIVDSDRFWAALQTARRGEEISMAPLMRTACVEDWLRNLQSRGFLKVFPGQVGTKRQAFMYA
jgi:asparagine synthase (glutamine-hydrolysing)